MTTVWGIHNDHFAASRLVSEGFVSVGWDEVGDLTRIGDNQEAMRRAVRAAYPDAKDGSIPGWAGTLRRFAFAISVGDLVISPDKMDRAVNIGRVAGSYVFEEAAPEHRHRRKVEWLVTGLPRASFSQPALNEIGSATTLFEVRTHALEFLNALTGAGHLTGSDGSVANDKAEDAIRELGREYLRAMRDGDSVFTPGRKVWTSEAASELLAAFVDRPDESGRSFDEKLDDQLLGVSDAGLQLFAELWCLSLAPLADYAPTTKRQLIGRVLQKMASPVELPPLVENALRSVAFSGGVAFKTRRPFQLALLVRFALAVSRLSVAERASGLGDPRHLENLLNSVPEPNEPAQRRALKWLLFPDYYLSIVGEKHLKAIRGAFAEHLDGTADNLDAELFQIRQALSQNSKDVRFYEPPVLDRWDPDRTLSGIPVTADEMPGRTRFKTSGYATATAALNLIPEGFWATYSDVAEVAGLTAGQVGEYVGNVEHPAGHRIIRIDGTTYPQFAFLPEGVTPREALEAEGVGFDDRGVADQACRITKEDLRERLDALGLLPRVGRRAWLVRGNNVNGRDLVPGWLADSEVSLAATSLRPVASGATRDELKPIVDEDYAHASYAAKAEKLDEFHNFLTRMQPGHLILTLDQGRVFIGEITGDAEYRAAVTGADTILARSVEWSANHVSVEDVAGDLRARLAVQRDVLDLTQQLSVVEALFVADKGEAVVLEPVKLELADATIELAAGLHVPQEWLQKCIDLLRDRPQLIFYGPPGTGKTYIAQKLAKHLAGDNVRLVQFHPGYSYEDFFEGFRPTEESGFRLKPGPMRRIVDDALKNRAVPHFLIIDEINRGNLAKVFGELYFLLEYRDENVELLYSDGDFSLPPNVFIIGTMNTADRSIALVDAAMRRRFAFLSLHPSEPPTSGVLREWLAAHSLPTRNADLLDELNSRIDDPDFKIGPSYLMRPTAQSREGLALTWETAILPLLEEHHFGERTRAEVADHYGLDAIARKVYGSTEPAAGDFDDAAPPDPA